MIGELGWYFYDAKQPEVTIQLRIKNQKEDGLLEIQLNLVYQ